LRQTVEAGKTLLVDGPASVVNHTGEVEVFGNTLKENERTIAREGKRLPFYVSAKAEFTISLGPKASFKEFAGCNIPVSWQKATESILRLDKRPLIVLIIGEADSGKSSFTTYLTNKLVSAKKKLAVLDGDLGQSDVGPPGTIAYALMSKPHTELYELKVANAFFVGETSPINASAKSIEGYNELKNEILSKPGVDCLLVNTDGWVSGEFAVKYKLQLISLLNPDIIVGIQTNKELDPLLNSIEKTPVTVVETSPAATERSPEKRMILRNLSYTKYLKDAKVRSLPMNHVEVKERKAIPKEPGEEKGVLVGLKSKKRFLGIGVITEIDRNRGTLKLLTPVKIKPATVIIGKIKLDNKQKETGAIKT
jgi:polynucleotide 5'-hydroxyl-kinase GRC3/NOL9